MPESQEILVEDKTKYYQDNFFRDLLKELQATARDCRLFQELCMGKEFDFDTTITHKNLENVPFIPTQFFKNSLSQFYQLLRVPRNHIASWHISSSTSLDPSIVGRTQEDLEQLRENWLIAWRKFLFLDQIDYTMNFAPGHWAMSRLVKRSGANIKGGRLYIDFINSIMEPYVDVTYIVKFKFWKTVAQLFRFRIRTVAELDKKSITQTLQHRKPEEGFCLGGNALLMNRLLTTEFKGEEYPLDEHGFVGTGGGGWDGVKAQLKMDSLDKPTFLETIQRIFHIPFSRIRDNYTFTETPSAFLAHWSTTHNDFVMHVMPNSKILVRNTQSLEPIKPGGEGLLEVITPYGVKGAACIAVLVDDIVKYLGDNQSRCPECGHHGATFIIKGRQKGAPGRSCSSILKWMEEPP